MKFLALNVDFSKSSLDPLDSRRPAHAGVKEGFPSLIRSEKLSFSDWKCQGKVWNFATEDR